MAWVKLDDGFYDNPKILRAGLAAAGLYVAGLSYAGRKLTDGFLPDAAVEMLVGDASTSLPGRLLEAGLWTIVEGGYQIHGFLDYNPPAAKVHAARAAAKDRMRGARSGNVRANTSARLPQMFARPVPVPVPVPGEEEEQKKLAFARKEKTAPPRTKAKTPWPEAFVLTEALAAYATRQGLNARYEWGKFQAHALRDDVRHADWIRAWEYWVRNAWELESRRRG